MGHSFLLLFLTNFIHKMSELDFFSAEPVEEDPAAAFLAREQDELAALEDDGFPSVTQAPAADIANVLGMTENAADVLETTPAPEPLDSQFLTELDSGVEIVPEEPNFMNEITNAETSEVLDDKLLTAFDIGLENTPQEPDITNEISNSELLDNQFLTEFDSGVENTQQEPIFTNAISNSENSELLENQFVAEVDSGLETVVPEQNIFSEISDSSNIVAPSESPVPSDVYAAISQVDRVRQEPEKIKVWREEQKKRLEEKDKEAEVKQAEWLVAAKHGLEEWYKHSAAQFEKTKVLNRETETTFIEERDENLPGHEWERICRLCEFNPKQSGNKKDISRMRSILLQLKQQPLVR